jgi:Na+/H+ antiporter NhaD/arsenite permease-like protein
VCLLLTPLVVAVAVEARLPVLPYLLALASAANLGGVVSWSGNPQNMIIGRAAAGEPGFAAYLALMLPIGVACLAGNAAVLSWLFRRQLPHGPLVERAPPKPPFDRVLATKALSRWRCSSGWRWPATAAGRGDGRRGAVDRDRAGAAAADPRPGRLVDPGVLRRAVRRGRGAARHRPPRARVRAAGAGAGRGDLAGDAAFVGLVTVGSNLVSNVPLVVIAVDWVPRLPDPTWGYVMLAVASTWPAT